MFFWGGRWWGKFWARFFLAEKGVSKIRFAKMCSESVVHPEVRFVGSRSLCYTRTWKGPWGSFFLGKKSLEFLLFLDFFGLNSGWWMLMVWRYDRCIFFDGILVDGMIVFGGLKMNQHPFHLGKICLDSRWTLRCWILMVLIEKPHAVPRVCSYELLAPVEVCPLIPLNFDLIFFWIRLWPYDRLGSRYLR